MATQLKMDLNARSIEVAGEKDFVQAVYRDFKDQLCLHEITSEQAERGFYELLDEARTAAAWTEPHRAYGLFKRALDESPKDVSSSVLAEVLEGLEQMQAGMAQVERELPDLETAVGAEPDNAEKRFFLALALY